MKKPTRKTHKIHDLTEDLIFEVLPVDAKGSRVGDPEECAGACALRRIPYVQHAWVQRSTTTLLLEDGTVVRGENAAEMQATVEGYDSTAGLFPPGKYRIKAPCPAHTEKGQRERNERNKYNRNGSRPASSRKRKVNVLR